MLCLGVGIGELVHVWHQSGDYAAIRLQYIDLVNNRIGIDLIQDGQFECRPVSLRDNPDRPDGTPYVLIHKPSQKMMIWLVYNINKAFTNSQGQTFHNSNKRVSVAFDDDPWNFLIERDSRFLSEIEVKRTQGISQNQWQKYVNETRKVVEEQKLAAEWGEFINT